ncbi:heat-inducible transcriptional repressor HrcA [Neokomagataea tanensis]|uniref:Heat-inducible transcription repressor HrcA n=1 Tax=Neokomagataea tanensis TaxID=661191 RepID=A0A4Y6V873_9PROT|nr:MULTISPECIES: heat-inducible transcriptional repressor HrcA [Neokomagataea]QDH25078.1 heat-inducible transcriptional repressor HrcA [Neokomagataea tanensis]
MPGRNPPFLHASAAFPAGLGEREAAILREIVAEYVETGEPIGSRTLSQRLQPALSPATIRNAMADLARAGLLFSPHVSAGRLPTEKGVRLWVEGLVQFGSLTAEDQASIDQLLEINGRSYQEILSEVSSMLSGLSSGAGLVLAPKADAFLKHIEFVPLGNGRALVILVGADGQVENRIIELPAGLPPSALVEAGNYLTAHLGGVTLGTLQERIRTEMAANQHELDALTAGMIKSGLGTWDADAGTLFVRGQSKLLADVTELERLTTVRLLFEQLETQDTMLELLNIAASSDGVRIFIGSESGMFGMSGMSMIVAPARNEAQRIVGAIGVIGPTRLNYGRIVPVVDYTARLVGRLLG